MRLVVQPARGAAKVHRIDGKVLLYIAVVNLYRGQVTLTPRYPITPKQLDMLKLACMQKPPMDDPSNPELWHHEPDGSWTTHVSIPLPQVREIAKSNTHRVQIRRLLCQMEHPRQRLVPEERELA